MPKKKPRKRAKAKPTAKRKSSPKASTRRTNHIIGVFGRKGSGKSYSVKRWIDAQPATRRVVVWDHNAEYSGAAASDPIRGARVFFSMRELLEYCLSYRCPNRVVLQAPRGEFSLFCRWAMRAADPSSGHVIVLDEVHCYCSPKQSPDELLEVMRVGRHSRVDVVFASQRIVGVHRDLTAQADELRFFHNTEPLDLKRIAEHCGTEFADGLRKLKQHSSSTWTG